MTAPSRIAGFMFHEVTDDPGSSGFQTPGAAPYRHTPRAFAECLDQIAAAGRTPSLITETDLSRPGGHLVLTFDDGGRSAMAISEQLAQRGWRGHFFIVTSLIGARTFLEGRDIVAIRKAGHVIGSHSHTHPTIFRGLPFERMMQEWQTSRDRLSQLLGEPILSASVPGGDSSAAVFESADRAGVRYLFTSEPWLTPRRVGGCWILGRFSAKGRTSPARIHELARFRGWTRALVRRRLKVWATLALPALYRLYVDSQTRPAA